MKEDEIVFGFDGLTAYMSGSKTAVIVSETSSLYPKVANPIQVIQGKPKVVPWGDQNDLPQQIMDKVDKNVFMSSNMLFNVMAGYGEGIMPVKRIFENNAFRYEPYEGNAEVKTFFEENNMIVYLLEQLTDLNYFYNVFPEVIFNKESGKKRKIVLLSNKEAAFSRWSEMEVKGEDKGKIRFHFYFADWGVQTANEENCVITPVLDRISPVRDLRNYMSQDEGNAVAKRQNRFIVPVCLPTPGRPYYQKPYWYSLIESGVYEFAQKIMPFKNAMLDNQSTVKYVVELGPNYFEDIFRREKIVDDKAKETRIKKEYKDIDTFLKGVKNTNKSIITYQKMDPKGQPYAMLTIKVIKNETMGGELIADNEEVANIIAYGMGVHPSLVGAAPGKSKTINGTEARELFILKQAMLKPVRDLVLAPLYLIKAINGWPDDLYFAIPNIELTTLDKNSSGVKTQIQEP